MKAFLQRMINVGFSTSERQHGIYFASNLTEIEHIIATHQPNGRHARPQV